MQRDDYPVLSTHQKALKINLDAVRYGTFAEIGAGQEVARWFFKVGGAAGTISKSMSAYDMAVILGLEEVDSPSTVNLCEFPIAIDWRLDSNMVVARSC